MSTRAIKFFKRRKIPFEVIEYEHKEKGAGFAAKATGFPLERIIKTLVVDIGNKKYALALNILPMAEAESLVCKVAKTRCPVSAA